MRVDVGGGFIAGRPPITCCQPPRGAVPVNRNAERPGALMAARVGGPWNTTSAKLLQVQKLAAAWMRGGAAVSHLMMMTSTSCNPVG